MEKPHQLNNATEAIKQLKDYFTGEDVSRYEISTKNATPDRKTIYCFKVSGYTTNGENVYPNELLSNNELWTDSESNAQKLVDLWVKKHSNTKVL